LRNKHTIFDDFEYRGHWYLPENPERKVPGTVRFDSARGITLELLQALRESPGTSLDEVYKPPLILGVSDNGTRMTLFQTVQTGRASSREEDPTFFYANYLFLGNHFYSKPEIRFSSLSVNFTYFEEWMGHAPFRYRSTTFEKVAAHYSPPEEVEATVREIEAIVTIHSELGRAGDGLRSIEWIHTGLLTIKPTEPKDVAWYRRVLDSLQKFMTLLVGKPVYPRLVSAWTHTDEPDEMTLDRTKTSSVTLFFHQEFRTPTPPRRSAHQSTIMEDILVPLPSIQEDLSQVLNAWFEEAERLDLVYEVFFGTLYNTSAYPRSQFLSLTQAAESFHRITKFGKYVRQDKYKEFSYAMKAAIPEAAPDALKNKLRSLFDFGNEYSLRNRIEDLTNSFPGREIIKKNPNLVKQVVETRNSFTHLSKNSKTKKRKANVLNGADLEAANEDLRILLTSLFLRRLDIDSGAVYNATRTMIRGRGEFLEIDGE
jgi:hypothetical protein